MVARWQIEPREADLTRLAPITRWSSLTVVERHNAAGAWELTGTPSDMARLEVPGRGVVISRNGKLIMSGWITKIAPSSSAVTVLGVSDFGLLDRRITFPNPGSNWTSQATNAYDVRSGAAETVLLQYINANAGPGAYAGSGTYNDRRDPLLVVPSTGGRGSSVARSSRFDLLSDLVGDIAEAGNLHVDVVHDEASGRRLLVKVRSITDRSANIRFGTPDALVNGVVNDDWGYEIFDPSITDALVAGGGIGTSRTQVYRRDNTARALWGGRVNEQFIDQRQSTDSTELANAATDALAANSAPVAVTFTVSDGPDIELNTDYFLGDKVGVLMRGVALDNVIREITHSVTIAQGEATEKRSTVVGSRDASQWVTATQSKLIKALRRLALLEAQ